MLGSGSFWFGVLVGVGLYWGYHRYAAKKASGQ